MTVYIQESRRFGVMSNLGPDVLLLAGFEGREEMSSLFEYTLQLRSEDDNIVGQSMVGQPIQFWVKSLDEKVRWFSGVVSRFDYLGRGDRLSIYRAQVVPWMWFLTRNQDCRIFQHMSIPEIIRQILDERGFTDYETKFIREHHRTLEYCVQYNESDFNFVSRLMERAGICYFFRHEQDRHVLVMADTPNACQPGLDPEVRFTDNMAERSNANEIWQWEHSVEFRTGRWAHKDFDFKSPQTDLLTDTTTLMDVQKSRDWEVFEYPGEYYGRDEGDTDVKLRIEAEEVSHDVVQGAGCCRGFSPGCKFLMVEHHSERECNREYTVTSVLHYMDASAQFTTGGGDTEGYQNSFQCIPADTPYRPKRVTPRPMIRGPQTAIIVGPAGEEIYTDEFGRVKVQFHWDRYGTQDERSSCWMRVSQVHAGQGWGMMDLPRIGEEVIVSFLEGNPDRPIIVGRVYNGQNMPPFDLPAQKTRRGNMTKTYKGEGFNEMSMDDTKDAEQIRIHAQKNLNTVVANDETHTVHNNRDKQVDVDETSVIGNDQSLTVNNDRAKSIVNNENVAVGNNRSTSIGNSDSKEVMATDSTVVGVDQSVAVGANQSIQVGATQSTLVGATQSNTVAGAQSESVGTNRSASVGLVDSASSGLITNLNAGLIMALSAGVTLSLNGPGGSITIGPSGVHIKGDTVVIEGGTVHINP